MRVDIHDTSNIAVVVPYGYISLPTDALIRIEEWANWARPRSLYARLDTHNRCASAEGRCESGYPEDSDRGRVVRQIDLHAILLVEHVVTSNIPQLNRDLVVRHFIGRCIPHATARALHFHLRCYGDKLRYSVLMIKNHLTTVKHDA